MIKIILFACTILVSTTTCRSGQPKDKSSDEQILEMLKTFYTVYITENTKMPIDIAKIESLKKQYCTTTLLQKIQNEEYDYDPFLKAQDCSIEWLNTLSIKRENLNNQYIVTYFDDYSKTNITIKIIIVKELDSYKIDSIM